MLEKFQIPGVAAIIVKEELGIKKILIQERAKLEEPSERGLIEIPAGKIREFENIFDTLRREVLEETGLHVTRIVGEESADIVQQRDYQVIGVEPYFVSQNMSGSYAKIVTIFLCQAEGEMLVKSDESENIRWIAIDELSELLQNQPQKFYPMYISVLRKYFKSQALAG
jgi:8-oxo-dGTP pyrophosphatase MutT (NUDIX family)